MQILLWVSRVFRIYSFFFQSHHVWQQSKDYSRLAGAQESQGYSILLKFYKFLLLVHLQLLRYCHSIDMPHLEGHSLEVWLILLWYFQLPQEDIHLCSYPHLLDFQCSTHHRNWCFGLCSCCNPFYCEWRKWSPSSCLSLLYFHHGGVELQHSWQGIACYFQSFQNLATLLKRSGLFHQCCYRS